MFIKPACSAQKQKDINYLEPVDYIEAFFSGSYADIVPLIVSHLPFVYRLHLFLERRRLHRFIFEIFPPFFHLLFRGFGSTLFRCPRRLLQDYLFIPWVYFSWTGDGDFEIISNMILTLHLWKWWSRSFCFSSFLPLAAYEVGEVGGDEEVDFSFLCFSLAFFLTTFPWPCSSSLFNGVSSLLICIPFFSEFCLWLFRITFQHSSNSGQQSEY